MSAHASSLLANSCCIGADWLIRARVQLMSKYMWLKGVFNSLFVLFHLPLMSRSHRLMLTHVAHTHHNKQNHLLSACIMQFAAEPPPCMCGTNYRRSHLLSFQEQKTKKKLLNAARSDLPSAIQTKADLQLPEKI